ncbi:sigma-70 family RNA polymerase sigma factor [bacterium]|nr:sigma-70 family RNA polymerase sigma factor [bacterium]
MSDQPFKSRLTDFFNSEYRKLVGFVRQKIDSAAEMDAEDFVQEVAINLFKRADVAAPIENLSAYVYRALQNQVIDFFRKKGSFVSLDQPINGSDTSTLADIIRLAQSRNTELEQRQISEELHQLLNLLKEDERALLIATELEGITFAELSKKWRVPINTLLSKKSRAMKKLMAAVENEV